LVGHIKQNWAWQVGARAGILVTPTLLAYVSGGYSQTHFTGAPVISTVAGGGPTAFVFSDVRTNGWFVGSGTEWHLSGLGGLLGRGWFWRNEYRIAHYGTRDITDINPTTGARNNDIRFDPWVLTVRSELVFKFDWTNPLVAKH
jgi:outer membrane immunogenic protein